MKFKIINGVVYDPTQKINKEKKDIYVDCGKIIEPSASEQYKYKTSYDVDGMIVMAGAIDIHSHIAGGNVNNARLLSPEIHLLVQPDINFVDTEEIQIKRFDSLNIDTLNFLTLDVQGFELEVLKGFGNELEKVEFIFTEINTKYLYKDNALVGDIDEYLKEYNFIRIYTNIDCFNYFGDAFYIKKTNKKYKKNFLKKIINRINISNYYLYINKLLYPKKIIKSIIRSNK